MNNDQTVIRALMYANACLLSAGEPGCPDLETAQRRSVAAMTHATEYLAEQPTPTLPGQRTRIHQLEDQVELREAARRDAEARAQAAEEDAREYGAALKVATDRLIKVEAELEKLKSCEVNMPENDEPEKPRAVQKMCSGLNVIEAFQQLKPTFFIRRAIWKENTKLPSGIAFTSLSPADITTNDWEVWA